MSTSKTADTDRGQMVECQCESWQLYSLKIFDAQIYCTMRTGVKYNGVLWSFCPWCGKELELINEGQS